MLLPDMETLPQGAQAVVYPLSGKMEAGVAEMNPVYCSHTHMVGGEHSQAPEH